MNSHFECSTEALEYLRAQDDRMARVIDAVGVISRETDPDLFSSVVHQIIAQQISTKAQLTIWNRLQEKTGEVTCQSILSLSAQELKALGISMRKVQYIQDFARQVQTGCFDPEQILSMSDEEAAAFLCTIKGCGVWTAQMVLLFGLCRPDVFSFQDAGILKGLRMVYGHEKIDLALFEEYRRMFSPYGSTASLYLWAVAAGSAGDLKDPSSQKDGKKKQN